jgi:hypothetical protein
MKATFCTLITMLLLGATPLSAQQNDMKVVGIVPFTAISYSDSLAAKDIYSTVARVLAQTKRFSLLELDKWSQLQDEITRQKGAAFMESKIVDQGKSLGAQILIFGAVREARYHEEYKEQIVTVSFDLKFVDVATNKTIASQTFSADSKTAAIQMAKNVQNFAKLTKVLNVQDDNVNAANKVLSNADFTNPKSVEEKFLMAVEKTSTPINKWVRSTFGLYLSMLKVTNEDDKQVSEILIEGGENIGIKEGDKLKTILATEIVTASGNKVKDEEAIAEIQVIEIRPQTAKCKVLSGGKKLLTEKANKDLEIVLE